MSFAQDADDFPAALRFWRRTRGLSQFDLAETVGVSTRHLSFFETGRAQPSRDMTMALCDGLMLTRAARNAFLVKAGFAPLDPATPLSSEALAPFRAILTEMMARHEPYPALICDRHWTIHDANIAGRALLAPLDDGREPMNVIRLLTHNPAAKDLILNTPEMLAEMIARLRLETLEAGPDPITLEHLRALEAAARAYPAPKTQHPRRPLVPLTVRGAKGPLRFLTTVAQFGTSEDITVRDLRLELFFPADAETRAALAG
jgi:transcriptional regulator with XRE-family HTH domain